VFAARGCEVVCGQQGERGYGREGEELQRGFLRDGLEGEGGAGGGREGGEGGERYGGEVVGDALWYALRSVLWFMLDGCGRQWEDPDGDLLPEYRRTVL
jgi:hypothetical protein